MADLVRMNDPNSLCKFCPVHSGLLGIYNSGHTACELYTTLLCHLRKKKKSQLKQGYESPIEQFRSTKYLMFSGTDASSNIIAQTADY